MSSFKTMRREDFKGRIGNHVACLFDGSASYVRVKDGERDLCGIFLASSRYMDVLRFDLSFTLARTRPTNVSNAMIYFRAPFHEKFHAGDKIMYLAPQKNVLEGGVCIVGSSRFEQMKITGP